MRPAPSSSGGSGSPATSDTAVYRMAGGIGSSPDATTLAAGTLNSDRVRSHTKGSMPTAVSDDVRRVNASSMRQIAAAPR